MSSKKAAPADDRRAVIRQLNDEFRRSPHGDGTVLLTIGVRSRGDQAVFAILAKVSSFAEFSEANDPHGEHDFGAFDFEGEKIFWKIDYYDLSLEAGSPDPANTNVTHRVLTIMLASEY